MADRKRSKRDGADELGRRFFNYRYHMANRDLRGWELVKEVPLRASRDVTERVYLWRPTDPSIPSSALVRVDVTERQSWRQAQRELSDTLGHCMRPSIPEGTGVLKNIGDKNFVARDPQTDSPAAVFFSRGNIAVAVSSVGEIGVDVSNVASTVDRALANTRHAGSRRTPAAALKKPAAKPRQPVVLVKDLATVVPSGAWLHVVAPDGELTRKGDQLIYVSNTGGSKRIDYSVRAR